VISDVIGGRSRVCSTQIDEEGGEVTSNTAVVPCPPDRIGADSCLGPAGPPTPGWWIVLSPLTPSARDSGFG